MYCWEIIQNYVDIFHGGVYNMNRKSANKFLKNTDSKNNKGEYDMSTQVITNKTNFISALVSRIRSIGHIKSVEQGLKEMFLHRQGQLELRTWDEFLDELHSDTDKKVRK